TGAGREAYLGFDGAGLKDALERLDESQRKQAIETMLGRGLRRVELTKLTAEGEGELGTPAVLHYEIRAQVARREGNRLIVPGSLLASRLSRRFAEPAERCLPPLVAALGQPQPRSVEARELLAHQAIDHLGESGADLEAEVLLQAGEVQALGKPQSGEEALAKVLLPIDLLGGGLADSAFLDARQIAFRGSVVHVPPREGAFAGPAGEAACAATGSDVLDAAPVERVVHRLAALAGEVRDLVAGVPSAEKLLADRLP